ncbi:MAG TPA: peptidoglycan editing factor PgeF [Gammaproteobacteria bacterium]|nr:peptidoglycan editing factor PgeF [Gammaproteobacteria bacterium]
MPEPGWIVPDWPAPATVRAVSTTRAGGYSRAPWDSLNLALHVGDDPAAVLRNRQHLARALDLPAEPRWLEQVHGTAVAVDGARAGAADAAVSRHAGEVCAVMTADCLPVLFCDRRGQCVAAAHAGWRGLVAGVLEETVAAMNCEPGEILAWLGPAIGPAAFEVGDEVRAAFLAAAGQDRAPEMAAFRPVSASHGERWLADLYALARARLARAGVTAIHGGGACTWHEGERFFSYRRDGTTGRMASLIWRVA